MCQAESWFVPTGVRSLRTRELSCLVSIDDGKIAYVALQCEGDHLLPIIMCTYFKSLVT